MTYILYDVQYLDFTLNSDTAGIELNNILMQLNYPFSFFPPPSKRLDKKKSNNMKDY